MNDEDRRLARLLSGEDVPSVQEEEHVLRRMLATQPSRSRGRVRALVRYVVPGASIVAAAAIGLLVWKTPSPTPDELTSRGAETQGVVELSCQPGPNCSRGDKLLFRTRGGPASGYLAAWAERPDGTAIWYFPQDAEGQSIPFQGERWIERGIALGDEHPTGTYIVHVYLSAQPLDRQTVTALADGESVTDDVVVMKTSLRVEP